MMQWGIALSILSVVVVGAFVFDTDIDASGYTAIKTFFAVLVPQVIVFSYEPLLIYLSALSFAVFFGLSIGLTIVIVYNLSRTPVE